MKIQQFLDHHGIARNPFADEDAQSDLVFKDHCIESTYHPTWDKVYGDPTEPATAVVFGEKGSGKTAMRLQIAKHLEKFNDDHPQNKLFVIHYDDFNHFLDRFRDTFASRRKLSRVLSALKLWDHMDAILTLATTGLVDRILGVKQPSKSVDAKIREDDVENLDRHQARDLLLLSACYDESTAETFKGRWHRLRKKLRFSVWKSYWDFAVGAASTGVIATIVIALAVNSQWDWVKKIWLWLLLLAIAWAARFWRACKNYWRASSVASHLRVGNRDTNPLRQVLMNFMSSEISAQPLPNKNRTDDRYELLCKFQGILDSLGFHGIIVLVDRIDEPHLIDGSAELMKALLWPMLDNKFLKHPGMGVKLMLPIELSRFVDREDRQFYQRARLDKQNMIPSFEWTGEALHDVTNARIQACAADGATPQLRDLFDATVTDQRLLETMRTLRVPRNLFKFLYRLLVAHCNKYTDSVPVWKISPETFEATLSVYQRDQDAFDRGVGAG